MTPYLLAFVGLASLGVLGYSLMGLRSQPAASVPVSEPEMPRPLPPIAGSASGWFNILSGFDLLEHCKTHDLIRDIERQSRLSHEVFERDMRPALLAYAEFVQLAPASEAHHHSHIGGLIAHTLEVVLAALTFRNGLLLPLHATTEIIDAQRDHWSYAVFFAALLHDVGKMLTDLQIDVRDSPTSPTRRWLPLSGVMTMSRALEYEVRFAPKSERDYQAHQRLSLVMLQAIVPANALAFLGRERTVLTALTKYLSGDDGVDEGAKALSDIVKKADQLSVARNLEKGPRQRFVTATAVPLNELLMQSIRHMLRDGTKLPLNRNGAAGWVWEGAVWFVAKRLADTVRTHIQEHYPDESIPGGNKNDRLFDTWQDYGLIEPNPIKGGAVWRVVVKGPDYELPPMPVLKFPLHRLFDDPTQYPVAMQGELLVVGGETTDDSVADDQSNVTPDQATVPAPASTDLIPAASDASVAATDSSARLTQESSEPTKLATAPKPVTTEGASAAKTSSAAFKIAAPKQHKPKTTKQPPVQVQIDQQAAGSKSSARETKSASASPADDLLPSGADVATYEAEKRQQTPRNEPAGLLAGVAPVLARVTPHAPTPPKVGAAREREPDQLAIDFVQWVQSGLASSAMSYNQADSMVHFVPEGIALVTPRIFREYAALKAKDVAPESVPPDTDYLIIQRKVIAAGWHAVGHKSNLLHYAVVSDGKRKGKLTAVVLRDPTKWLTEVPPINTFLQRFEPDPPS